MYNVWEKILTPITELFNVDDSWHTIKYGTVKNYMLYNKYLLANIFSYSVSCNVLNFSIS